MSSSDIPYSPPPPPPPPPSNSSLKGPPPPSVQESAPQPGPPPPTGSSPSPQAKRNTAQVSETDQATYHKEKTGDKVTAEAGQIVTDQNIFLWGKTRAGKTSLIAAFHKASICSPESKIDFIAKDEQTREFISGVNLKILSELQAVAGTQSVDEKPQTFILRDLHADRAIELSVPDGPGGAMFEGRAGGKINQMMKAQAEKLNAYARVANQIVFCVNSTEKDQNYYGVSFVNKLDEIADETTKTLSCSRFIIVLTKVDLLASFASESISQRLTSLMPSEYTQHNDMQSESGVSPLSVVEWIDPVEMAKTIIGPYALNQLMSYLKPDAELVVALCSAWGFDPNTGYPVANAQGAFNTQHLFMDSDESELEFWRPYGVNSILEYILRGTHSTNLQPITRADLTADLVDQGGRI